MKLVTEFNILLYKLVLAVKYICKTNSIIDFRLGSSSPRQPGVLEKYFLRKSSCSKWLLSLQYNRCCFENIAALMRSFFMVNGVLGYKESALIKVDDYKFLRQKNIQCR